ncbi:hypothetical protein AB0869_10685 [Micromonospora vinacea]|uniref:hypothetical protein n=1 Tax=Micromonospora vinacea TaxID=709878 RepID=UPI003456430D
MPERPVARDDSVVEHQPPPERYREPGVSARDVSDARAASEARHADGADDHESHDPYQPL